MRTVLITGAARGLGRSMLEQRVSEGWQVIAVDRSCGPLADAENVTCVEIDMTADTSIDRVLSAIDTPIDQLVHAAGISAAGAFEEIPWSNQKAVWEINFQAPIKLTQALLQAGHFAKNAKLCFVASLSHQLSYPGAASYAGSKDGLASYAKSLAKAKTSLTVTVAYPGPLRTEHAARYAPDNSEKALSRRMPADVAASLILRDLDRGRSKSLPGFGTKCLALLGTVAPGLAAKMIRKAVFEKITDVKTETTDPTFQKVRKHK